MQVPPPPPRPTKTIFQGHQRFAECFFARTSSSSLQAGLFHPFQSTSHYPSSFPFRLFLYSCAQTDGLIWVVDSADRGRLQDCKRELHDLLTQEVIALDSLRCTQSYMLVVKRDNQQPASCTGENLNILSTVGTPIRGVVVMRQAGPP